MKIRGFYLFPALISLVTGCGAGILLIVLDDQIDLLTSILGSIVGFIVMVWVYYRLSKPYQDLREIRKTEMSDLDQHFLDHHVLFYHDLNTADKRRFEKDVQIFLYKKKITPIDCKITHQDKLLIASSAIIPIFGFDEWDYPMLHEVLIYPRRFNSNYATEGGNDRAILGMVGNGVLNGKMILSLPSLQASFSNVATPGNVGIHEFTHLIDSADGATDGLPGMLLEKQYIVPWLNLIHKEIEKINKGKSDINPYGATNQQEFFAVASEYFFTRPDLLKTRHPELYSMLSRIFKQDVEKIMGDDLKHLH